MESRLGKRSPTSPSLFHQERGPEKGVVRLVAAQKDAAGANRLMDGGCAPSMGVSEFVPGESL